eukprot:151322-Pleurochrysis_carterae.AAC.2
MWILFLYAWVCAAEADLLEKACTKACADTGEPADKVQPCLADELLPGLSADEVLPGLSADE